MSRSAVIIGSGISGLTAALYLLKAGYKVRIYEQGPEVGGVTASLCVQGYTWDLGQLVVEGFGPGEQVGLVLEELGLCERIELMREDRAYVFPDFQLWKPATYAGPFWRRDRLAEIFPDEREGLARYYRFYLRMMEVMTLARFAERASGASAWLFKIGVAAKLLPLLPKRNWTARQMMDHFFRSKRLQAVFTSILADFVVSPSRFPGLALPAVNPETAFDNRVPLELSRWGRQPSYHYVRGGVGALTRVMREEIEAAGGSIYTATPVRKIIVERGAFRGLLVGEGEGEEIEADLALASGGACESLVELAGREHFDDAFLSMVDQLPLMESVFMVHLGIDFDPSAYQKQATCYYYGTYDIEQAVEDLERGRYHEGRDGFVVYLPSAHSPEMAPAGYHAVTVYTVAPNELEDGSWSTRREEFADKLLAAAERAIPDLRKRTTIRVILTPEDFKRRTHLAHHSFGGVAPVLGKSGVPHITPIRGLWFIGAQSESGAGMNNVMHGVWRTIKRIKAARGSEAKRRLR